VVELIEWQRPSFYSIGLRARTRNSFHKEDTRTRGRVSDMTASDYDREGLRWNATGAVGGGSCWDNKIKDKLSGGVTSVILREVARLTSGLASRDRKWGEEYRLHPVVCRALERGGVETESLILPGRRAKRRSLVRDRKTCSGGGQGNLSPTAKQLG